MKLKHTITMSMLAVAGLATLGTSAQAAMSYNDGDLILGLRTTGTSTPATTDYLVNIGNASLFAVGGTYHDGNLHVLSLSGVGSDVSGLLGANWYNSSSTLWSISGTEKTAGNGFGSNTLFASRGETTVGVASTPWNRGSSAAQGSPAGKMQNLGLAFAGGSPTGNDPVGSLQSEGTINSYKSYQPGGANSTGTTAYSYFNGGLERNFGVGADSAILDLYQLSTGSGVGTLLGAFRFGSDGSLAFSSDLSDFAASPVPEPSTVGFGLLALGACMVRRVRKAGVLA